MGTQTFANLQTEVARLGNLDATNESAKAAAWTRGGLRAIARAGAWEWLRAATTITLSAGDYTYDPATDFFRLDTRSFRTGGRDSYLTWRKLEWIDDQLGPNWRDSGTANGTPEYITRMGNELWTASKPSSSFVSDNSTLYYYYWRHEPTSGTLYLPDAFFEIAVQFSLAYGMLQDFDPRADAVLARCQNIYLLEMRAAKLDMGYGDRVHPPDWMWNFYDGGDVGDGYQW